MVNCPQSEKVWGLNMQRNGHKAVVGSDFGDKMTLYISNLKENCDNLHKLKLRHSVVDKLNLVYEKNSRFL